MSQDTAKHQGQRNHLIDELRSKGITNESVLAAMNRVPRHVFLDSSFEQFAYRDVAFPIRADQTISQPYTVAFQSQALGLERGSKVLEIGTGSGYQAAVLHEMGFKVYSIERQKELFDFSKSLLLNLKYKITQKFGDGYKGMPFYAPFDGILITAAAPEVPMELVHQLNPEGVLLMPLGRADDDQIMKRITFNKDGTLKEESMGNFRFVPMLKNVSTK
ncbi:MAG: protein-L-isoaspartate(D-aspartate) O-methyltransferase [Schleiferiaceae bacterium]